MTSGEGGHSTSAGLSQDEFARIAEDIRQAWSRASTRDDAFRVIVEFGQKHGYKNVIAAIQGRTPKRFTREKSLSEWVDERQREERTS